MEALLLVEIWSRFGRDYSRSCRLSDVCHRDAFKVQLKAAAADRANGAIKEGPAVNGSSAAGGQATW